MHVFQLFSCFIPLLVGKSVVPYSTPTFRQLGFFLNMVMCTWLRLNLLSPESIPLSHPIFHFPPLFIKTMRKEKKKTCGHPNTLGNKQKPWVVFLLIFLTYLSFFETQITKAFSLKIDRKKKRTAT